MPPNPACGTPVFAFKPSTSAANKRPRVFYRAEQMPCGRSGKGIASEAHLSSEILHCQQNAGRPKWLGAAERQVIKQYVVKEKLAPVRTKERVVIGDTLPSDIELHAVPADWGPKLTKYKYIYSNSHVYLVEASDRKIIQDID